MNKKIDAFFSHHTDSCKSLVIETAKMIEELGWTCWYAERDIKSMRNYTEEIPNALENCRLFVLFLNEYANQSDEVLREIQLAANSVPILILQLDKCEPRKSIKYICSASQMKIFHDVNITMLAQQACEEVCALLGDEKAVQALKRSDQIFRPERSKNELNFYGDAMERDRLKMQHRFVVKFAKESYHSILSRYENASFLDVGCNTGRQAMLLLEGSNAVSKYVGLDREQAALDKGKELYPEASFFVADCEAPDFDKHLCEIKESLGIEAFDIINISMLLLHTKSPDVLIDVLENHLSEDGTVIVLDIDDGFTVSYPDKNGYFQRAIDICHETIYSGFRHSGRQVYHYLHSADLTDITMHKIGLSSIGMKRSERDDFFEVYFSFILDDLRKMHEIDPENRVVSAELKWLEECYRDMKIEFKNSEHFFNLGFMLLSARRQD